MGVGRALVGRAWTGGGGRGRVWEGRWGLYKGPQRPPASQLSSPAALRARVQPYIGLFLLDVSLRLPFGEGGGRATVSRQRGL